MAKIFLIFGGLHEKHAVQRGILVPTQHSLWHQGKPRKPLIEFAGRRTFPHILGLRYQPNRLMLPIGL
jgi:hypothetical protein